MIGLLNPYLWGSAAAVLLATNSCTLWQTWSWRDEENEKTILVARAAAEDRVRKEERASTAAVLALERANIDRLRNHVALAGTSLLEAKHALANIPSCPIPRATVRLLQPSTARHAERKDTAPAPAPDGRAAAPGAVPGRAETVEVSDLLATCKRNYELVCEPNRLQVLGLQEYARLAYEACGAK